MAATAWPRTVPSAVATTRGFVLALWPALLLALAGTLALALVLCRFSFPLRGRALLWLVALASIPLLEPWRALPLLAGRDDAADWLRRLREAALADEEGRALDGALATVRAFA